MWYLENLADHFGEIQGEKEKYMQYVTAAQKRVFDITSMQDVPT